MSIAETSRGGQDGRRRLRTADQRWNKRCQARRDRVPRLHRRGRRRSGTRSARPLPRPTAHATSSDRSSRPVPRRRRRTSTAIRSSRESSDVEDPVRGRVRRRGPRAGDGGQDHDPRAGGRAPDARVRTATQGGATRPHRVDRACGSRRARSSRRRTSRAKPMPAKARRREHSKARRRNTASCSPT